MKENKKNWILWSIVVLVLLWLLGILSWNWCTVNLWCFTFAEWKNTNVHFEGRIVVHNGLKIKQTFENEKQKEAFQQPVRA